ncbi:MAG: hypothetical protein WD646_08940 [Actinomycetota bacterium]
MKSVDVSTLPAGRWIVGIVVIGIVGGHFAAGLAMGRKGYWSRFRRSLAIGIVERLFFGIGIALNVPVVAPAMIGWVATKMAAGWNLETDSEKKDRRFAALRGSLASMFAAALGGLVAGGMIRW